MAISEYIQSKAMVKKNDADQLEKILLSFDAYLHKRAYL